MRGEGRGGEGKEEKGHLEPMGFSGFPSTHPCHLQPNLPYQLLSLGSSPKENQHDSKILPPPPTPALTFLTIRI